MIRQSTQPATGQCDCGSITDIKPTQSPYEFDWACRGCTRLGTISWAHAHPPPVYVGAVQPELFTEAR
jgi:hypothetical protein